MKIRVPIYCNVIGVSEFVPSFEPINAALQATQVPNMQANGVTIEDMQNAPELFKPRQSDFDKLADVQEAQRAHMPKVREATERVQSNYANISRRGAFPKGKN